MIDYYELLADHLPKVVTTNDSGELGMRCPFHKGGRERTASFYFNRNTGLAWCHKEHRGWNTVSLLKELGVPAWKRRSVIEILKEHGKFDQPKRKLSQRSDVLPEKVLGLFDHDHPYMVAERGFPSELIEQEEIGYDPKSERVTFPVRSKEGLLLGVSGRAVGDDNKRYRWFKEVFKQALPAYEPYAGDYLWGLDKVYPTTRKRRLPRVILVEGYMQRLRMLQYGYDETLAVLGGAGMSDRQVEIIRGLADRVVLFFDLDEGGMALVARALRKLPDMDVRVVVDWPDEPGKTQPDALTPDEVSTAVESAVLAIKARRMLKMDHSLMVQRHVDRKGGAGGNKRTYTDAQLKRQDFELRLKKDRSLKVFPIKYTMVDPSWWEPTFGMEINYYPVRQHRRWYEGKNGQKGRLGLVVCSSGWDEHDPQPCNGCYEYDAKGKESPVNRSVPKVVVVLVDEVYHEVEKEGRKGTKYTRHFLCDKLNCKDCKKGVPKERGRLMYLPISGRQWDQFLEANAMAAQLCSTCGDTCALVGIACQACGETILDEAAWDSEPNPNKFLINSFKCSGCGHVDLPGGLYVCSNEWEEAGPADIWGCRVKVRRIEGGIAITDPEVGGIPDDLLHLTEPLDLPSLFPPDSLEDQSAVLSIENHYE